MQLLRAKFCVSSSTVTKQLGQALVLAVLLLATSTGFASSEIIWVNIKDPSLKEALYDSYQGKHFSAITRLQSAQKLGRVISQEKSGLVLGGLYLAYGFHDHAAGIFEALLNDSQPLEVRDQAWFYLAKIRYRRGNFSGALNALSKVRDSLDFRLRQERYLLQGSIHLQKGEYIKALKALKNVNERSDWGLYAKYNKGVAKYHLGREKEGIQLLDEVGSVSARDPEIEALRDKANLVLSYGFLDKSDPDQAANYLQRMKLSGPFANKALLALGRAYSDKKQFEESLSPWLKLVERHPSDPAVQDALMAVPFALGQLEAFKQSLEFYEKAMLAFQSEIKKINSAAESVSGGKMLDGMIQVSMLEQAGQDDRFLKDVLDTPEGRYLIPLFSSYEFRETLHNYAALRLSLGKLERWSANLDTYKNLPPKKRKAYEERITRIQSKILLSVEKYRHHLQSMAFNELERRKTRIVSYFNEARFSVAQIYDYAAKRWGDDDGKK